MGRTQLTTYRGKSRVEWKGEETGEEERNSFGESGNSYSTERRIIKAYHYGVTKKRVKAKPREERLSAIQNADR